MELTREQIAARLKSIIGSLRAAADDLQTEVDDLDNFEAAEDACRGALTHAEEGVNNLKRLIGSCNGRQWG